MNNIYYFSSILKIGGTEQFLYEIAKKYHKYDLTIFYDYADPYQLARLKKLVRCRKRKPGEKIKCKRAFFNFNIDMIEDVEADDYYFVIHANYDEIGYIPPTHPKINHYIGVSEFATRRFIEDMGIEAEKCYNPIALEPKEKIMHLVSACRLDDPVKGGERTQRLIKALDNYCEKNNRHYIWHIFTNTTTIEINSKNVCLMKPRVDVRPYIADADYALQLSNDMETYCYAINEALGYGVPIITTPLSVVKELPIDDNMRIELEYDCSNVEEVAKQIFEKEVKPFKYNTPEDRWDQLLIQVESTYEEEMKMKYLIEATKEFETIVDKEVDRTRKEKEQWEVTRVRLEELQEYEENNNKHIIVVVKQIEEKKAIIKDTKRNVKTRSIQK